MVSFHHMWDWLESDRRYVTVFTDTLSRMLLHVMQSIWQICDLASASIPDLYDTVASYFTSYCEFANDVPIADLAKQSTCCSYYVTFYDYGCCIVLKNVTTVHTVGYISIGGQSSCINNELWKFNFLYRNKYFVVNGFAFNNWNSLY